MTLPGHPPVAGLDARASWIVAGSYSIRIDDQWRITFRIENNRALDVMIEDYH